MLSDEVGQKSVGDVGRRVGGPQGVKDTDAFEAREDNRENPVTRIDVQWNEHHVERSVLDARLGQQCHLSGEFPRNSPFLPGRRGKVGGDVGDATRRRR